MYSNKVKVNLCLGQIVKIIPTCCTSPELFERLTGKAVTFRVAAIENRMVSSSLWRKTSL